MSERTYSFSRTKVIEIASCDTCGAAVLDLETHSTWHGRLVDLLDEVAHVALGGSWQYKTRLFKEQL